MNIAGSTKTSRRRLFMPYSQTFRKFASITQQSMFFAGYTTTFFVAAALSLFYLGCLINGLASKNVASKVAAKSEINVISFDKPSSSFDPKIKKFDFTDYCAANRRDDATKHITMTVNEISSFHYRRCPNNEYPHKLFSRPPPDADRNRHLFSLYP